jgi:hypothetical protein
MEAIRPRQTARLNAKLDKRLFAYAAAASAAGVGALALPQPVEAKVVYTPAHVVVTSIPNTSYAIDLNHDGITDFSLYGAYQDGESQTFGSLACKPVGPLNMVWGRNFESALAQGVKVGHGGIFNRKFPTMGWFTHRNTSGSLFYGYWVNGGEGVQNRYLGLKFAIDDKIHYGWARLTVSVRRGPDIRAVLTGYAYETVANKFIVTGRTKGADARVYRATLGHLARGAATSPRD